MSRRASAVWVGPIFTVALAAAILTITVAVSVAVLRWNEDRVDTVVAMGAYQLLNKGQFGIEIGAWAMFVVVVITPFAVAVIGLPPARWVPAFDAAVAIALLLPLVLVFAAVPSGGLSRSRC